MGNTWGRKVPLKEVLRKNKREINKAVRELDRERANLEKQEQKLVADIKKYAKDGQMGPVKIMAKDLVRTRTYITKFIELRSHLNAVALKLQTVKSQEAMARAMKSVTEAMVRMNKTVNIPSIQKIMVNFQVENERAEMTQEVMVLFRARITFRRATPSTRLTRRPARRETCSTTPWPRTATATRRRRSSGPFWTRSASRLGTRFPTRRTRWRRGLNRRRSQ